ncbi:winged helix-turn-helix transcriptional regulator [Bacillus carboniphilus]|uniref:Winged helix-turn-helix transcriptional regulator n=1 Tax=Bacillus carboniphilus TaxID=86663 RepID=A0ABN0WNB4_9BACI
MNEKETLILQIIQENPFITQNEMAERTGLSRSAIAGYISTLTKQGKLLGRAYVIPNNTGFVCIGGANIDKKLQVNKKLIYGTSNPAFSTKASGGVARNVAENLGRLGSKVSLITVVGDDHEGQWLLDHTKRFVDVTPSQVWPEESTGTYTALLNESGEMEVALADMGIYDKVTVSFIEKRWGFLSSAGMIFLDTNFSTEVMEYVIKRCAQEDLSLTITPVSSPKAKNLPNQLRGVTWLIANQEEAEVISNHQIVTDGDYFKAAEEIVKKGVESAVITRGDKGLIYYTKAGEAGAVIPPSSINVKDVTGAGDSLVSGILYASAKGFSTEDACKLGVACSILTLQTNETVNTSLNHSTLLETFHRYFK